MKGLTSRLSFVMSNYEVITSPLVYLGQVWCLIVSIPYLCHFSYFDNHFEEEVRVGCFAFIVLRMSCYSKCFVTLPHGAMGWFAMCVIVVFPDHTHFLKCTGWDLNHLTK